MFGIKENLFQAVLLNVHSFTKEIVLNLVKDKGMIRVKTREDTVNVGNVGKRKCKIEIA